MTVEIVGRQRLLDPGKVELLQPGRAADRLVDGETLVAVGHDLEAIAERLAHCRQAIVVLRAVRLADLDLGT
ncbi:hypothetical protein D3C86_2058470 [compost metagenome]